MFVELGGVLQHLESVIRLLFREFNGFVDVGLGRFDLVKLFVVVSVFFELVLLDGGVMDIESSGLHIRILL